MSSKILIDKKILEHLVELSRIELDKKSEEKLLRDLQKILGHFEELKEVDTENVEPMAGGAELKNVFREDKFIEVEKRGKKNIEADLRGKLIDQFLEKEKGFLKVPAVFE